MIHVILMVHRLMSSRRPTRYYSPASHRVRTACTWKCMSYFPTSWAISWSRFEKGSLCIRSSVLFWKWQSLQRSTIPSQYLWGLFNSPALETPSFLGALPTIISQSFFWAGLSQANIDGPTLATISANCLIGDDSGDLPTCSSFFTSSLLCSTLPWVWGPLQL